MMEEIIPMMRVSCVACVLVLVAMAVDLVSGWRKARARGEAHNSYALRRSVTKFILYEGSMAIAVCIDVLLHFARMYTLLGADVLVGVPFVSCLVGILILVVEGLSVYEKADGKTRDKVRTLADALHRVLTRDEITAISEAIERARKRSDDDTGHTV